MKIGRRNFLQLLVADMVVLVVSQAVTTEDKLLTDKERQQIITKLLTDEEKQKIIAKMLSTPEGKARLVASMSVPKRCGGLDYINGKPYYRYGGKLYTPEEFDKL